MVRRLVITSLLSRADSVMVSDPPSEFFRRASDQLDATIDAGAVGPAVRRVASVYPATPRLPRPRGRMIPSNFTMGSHGDRRGDTSGPAAQRLRWARLRLRLCACELRSAAA